MIKLYFPKASGLISTIFFAKFQLFFQSVAPQRNSKLALSGLKNREKSYKKQNLNIL